MIKQTIFLNCIYLTGKNLHQSRFSIPPGILGKESEVETDLKAHLPLSTLVEVSAFLKS